jgi:hypothetical protein
VRLEGLGKLKKSTSSGIRTGDLPVCSVENINKCRLYFLNNTVSFIQLPANKNVFELLLIEVKYTWNK